MTVLKTFIILSKKLLPVSGEVLFFKFLKEDTESKCEATQEMIHMKMMPVKICLISFNFTIFKCSKDEFKFIFGPVFSIYYKI